MKSTTAVELDVIAAQACRDRGWTSIAQPPLETGVEFAPLPPGGVAVAAVQVT